MANNIFSFVLNTVKLDWSMISDGPVIERAEQPTSLGFGFESDFSSRRARLAL